MASFRQPWWRGALLYQIYPRSFADSDGDGVGDLNGIRGRLDYLESLGVDGLWLTPTFPSPNHDWGYDVSNYYDVHPELGTLDDLDALVREAGERGIRVLLDLVPAHTSDAHEWFVESRSSRESPKRSWYIWRDEANEQESVFGGRAWTFDESTGQYYHHRFLAQQPDLNWLNAEVRDAFDDILRLLVRPRDRRLPHRRRARAREGTAGPGEPPGDPRRAASLADARRRGTSRSASCSARRG